MEFRYREAAPDGDDRLSLDARRLTAGQTILRDHRLCHGAMRDSTGSGGWESHSGWKSHGSGGGKTPEGGSGGKTLEEDGAGRGAAEAEAAVAALASSESDKGGGVGGGIGTVAAAAATEAAEAEEYRIDPADSFAYARRDFDAKYGEGAAAAWDAAAATAVMV